MEVVGMRHMVGLRLRVSSQQVMHLVAEALVKNLATVVPAGLKNTPANPVPITDVKKPVEVC